MKLLLKQYLLCGESNMETYITTCKRDSQEEFTVWLRKLKQGLCINLEGWDGEGGDECIPMADSLRFDRKQENSVKQSFS